MLPAQDLGFEELQTCIDFISKQYDAPKSPFPANEIRSSMPRASCVGLPAHLQPLKGFDIKDLNKENAEARSFDYSFFFSLLSVSLFSSFLFLSSSTPFHSSSFPYSFFFSDDAFRN